MIKLAKAIPASVLLHNVTVTILALLCLCAILHVADLAAQERPLIQYRGSLPAGWVLRNYADEFKTSDTSFHPDKITFGLGRKLTPNDLYAAYYNSGLDKITSPIDQYTNNSNISVGVEWKSRKQFEKKRGIRTTKEKFVFGTALSYLNVDGNGEGSYEYFVPIAKGQDMGVWIECLVGPRRLGGQQLIKAEIASMVEKMKDHVNHLTIPASVLDDGSGGLSTQQPESPTEWTVYVGPIATGLVAGGIISAIATILGALGASISGSRRTEKKPKDPDRVARYILNPSTDRLSLAPGKRSSFEVTAWAVTESGKLRLANEVELQITGTGTATRWLGLSPNQGRGRVHCQVEAGPNAQPSVGSIDVTASGGGGAGAGTASITIEIQSLLTLAAEMIHSQRSESEKDGFAVFDAEVNRAGDSWIFHELVAYFHTADSNDPLKPQFTPVWDDITVEPDYVELTPLTTDAEGLTWRCSARMRPGATPSAQWLAEEGVVKLTYKCQPQKVTDAVGPGRYTAKVGLRLPPLLELAYRLDAEPDKRRIYKDYVLQDTEFVADGEDCLGLVFFLRTRATKDKSQQAEGFDLRSVDLELSDDAEGRYEIKPDETFKEPGQLRFFCKSKDQILHREESIPSLVFKAIGEYARIGEKASSRLQEPIEITVQPLPLFLRLWVIPGKLRGTSDAGVIAGAALPRAPWFAPLKDLELELAITSAGGGPDLAIQGASARVTGAHGDALWILSYSGLSFGNIGQGELLVKCRVSGSDEATTFPISVGRNVLEFLKDLEANANALQLTNPQFQHTSLIGEAADYLWPDSTLGLLYNFRGTMSEAAEKVSDWKTPPEWKQYVCGELAKRLLHWSMQRRFGYGRYTFEVAQRMNGIELGEYAFNHLHDFFGFNLSGNDPWKETKFIDPWWNQAFDDKVVLSLTEERVKLAGAIAFLLSATALVALFMGEAFTALCLRFAPSLHELLLRWLWACTRGKSFNLKQSIGVFSTLSAAITAYIWPTLWADMEMFADDDLTTYNKHPKKWLVERSEMIQSRAEGLPTVESIEPW